MLGIYLIICMMAYCLVKLKVYSLVKGVTSSVELSSEPRTYEICRRAVILDVVSYIILLLGYAGCAWPYLFIPRVELKTYLSFIVMLGLYPVLLIAFVCFRDIRYGRGYLRISTDVIEYKRGKTFTVQVKDIRKITYPGLDEFLIHLKEKNKKPLSIHVYDLYHKNEVFALMGQLRQWIAVANGLEKSFAYRFSTWGVEMMLGKYGTPLFKMIPALLLLYTSYCCIDYDYIRQDYTALYNALNADSRQTENAWPYYVQAAAHYIKLDSELQGMIRDKPDPNRLDFTDEQADELRTWFSENSVSWASLKKASAINYCNATYEHISILDSTNRDDFSTPSDTGYGQIKNLYLNTDAGCSSNVLDSDWFDLFRMQVVSSKHFAGGKSLIDQLVGYAMLARSVKLLAQRNSWEPGDLNRIRALLKEHYPDGLTSFSIEGEILLTCSDYDEMVNLMKIPVQTPLNPIFLMVGSNTGTEIYVRNRFKAVLEQVDKGIDIKEQEFSIFRIPVIRHTHLDFLESSLVKVYKISRRANTNLSAAYFILDLEEYRLLKGGYPVDSSQLKQAGLNSELPDDSDGGGKIIYRYDGQKAILYAVGPNAKDDGGFKDERGNDNSRDDIVYWRKDLK